MKSSTTLQDVAALAGVSAKTASRVVNGDPAVTEKTAKRVRKAIATLNFVPNPHARSLRTGRDQAIALIIDSISRASIGIPNLSNPAFRIALASLPRA